MASTRLARSAGMYPAKQATIATPMKTGALLNVLGANFASLHRLLLGGAFLRNSTMILQGGETTLR